MENIISSLAESSKRVIIITNMTMKKIGSPQKESLSNELQKILITLKELQKNFKSIQKQLRNLTKKASVNSDDKKVQAVRKKLAGH